MTTNLTYSFRIAGIPTETATEYRGLPDDELKKRNVIRYTAGKKPGYPCRVSLVDAEIGEYVLLLNFAHLQSWSPYRSIGPIFVRESALERYSETNAIPEVLRVPGRLLSIRAYNNFDMLISLTGL